MKTKTKNKPITATDLIKDRLKRAVTYMPPSQEALRELKQILSHNDAMPPNKRISREAVLALLRSHGWAGGRDSLNALCVHELGRASLVRAA